MLKRVRMNSQAAQAARAAQRRDQIALSAPVQFHRATAPLTDAALAPTAF
jgi:hypothetical protein